MAGFTIHDDHGQGRALTVLKVFQYSSNIGTAKIAGMVDLNNHKAFLTRLGLLTKMNTELPEVSTPTQPRVWKPINQATISFGHGVATTPLQTAMAGAALINGGKLFSPTFLPSTPEQAASLAKQLVDPSTSSAMRFLFKWNGVKGSGRSALVDDFDAGGKIGTADKVINGRYAAHPNLNAFPAGFPIDKPQYVVLTIIYALLTGEKGREAYRLHRRTRGQGLSSATAPFWECSPNSAPETQAC